MPVARKLAAWNKQSPLFTITGVNSFSESLIKVVYASPNTSEIAPTMKESICRDYTRIINNKSD